MLPCSFCQWFEHTIVDALVQLYLRLCRLKSLRIIPFGGTMAFQTISVGGTTTFTVVPLNAEGVVVPDTGITATSDTPAVATVTVNPDGSGGIVTGVSLGSYNISATDSSGIV